MIPEISPTVHESATLCDLRDESFPTARRRAIHELPDPPRLGEIPPLGDLRLESRPRCAAVHDLAERIVVIAGRDSLCLFVGNGCRAIAEAANEITMSLPRLGRVGWLALSRPILSHENREKLIRYLSSEGVSPMEPGRICIVDSLTFPVRTDRRFTPSQRGANSLFFVSDLAVDCLVGAGLSRPDALRKVVPIGLPECRASYGSQRAETLEALDEIRGSGFSDELPAVFLDPMRGTEFFRDAVYRPGCWGKFAAFDQHGAPTTTCAASGMDRALFVRQVAEQIAFSRGTLSGNRT